MTILQFSQFLKKHQFKLLVLLSVIIIVILWYTKDHNTQGTYSQNFFYIPDKLRQKQTKFDSKGEVECRRVLEALFDKQFPKQRPLFLHNDVTGHPLEIDCCNLEMKLGVEYNGVQHYKFVPRFHKNYETFMLQQYRDNMKEKMCKENGFRLITVPYTIPLEKIQSFIQEKLREMKIDY